MKEEWKAVNIDQILTPDQIKKLDQIYVQADGDLTKMINACKEWFNEPEMAKQLYAKDFVPSFAGYCIPFHYLQAKKKARNN